MTKLLPLLARYLGRNWKSYAGGAIIIAAAVALGFGVIDPHTALLLTQFGEGLLGIGLAHKLERAIAVGKELLALRKELKTDGK